MNSHLYIKVGWKGVSIEDMRRLSLGEIGQMLITRVCICMENSELGVCKAEAQEHLN